ncbi:MAG: hypothetical protein JJLCMIEE_03610 [Acidimicrobiales bacterium]|nr:MAG: hypothetical protein EDR02_18440 [Actinomycetota bacterium]MBV6510454.1 hypothetical protein [Acidimicrobiales bacterium]RIK02374.1 MAG: hypothetical protein DCC48_18230 [Acidobacteriota bacterium]
MTGRFPLVDRQPLRLPLLDKRASGMWHTLCDLSEVRPGGWSLIGAQMVLLHGLEHGQTPPRASEDLDALIDVRLVSGAVRSFVAELANLGFELEGADPDGVAHRYRRAGISVDVLAPDGLGRRADLTTTPPGRTIAVPGGTQALQRSELVPILHEDRHATVARPSLLAAIVLKACAVDVDDVPDAQRVDLAFLLGLVDDPIAVRDQMTGKDRKRLRARHELGDPAHPAWAASGARERGLAALELLLG